MTEQKRTDTQRKRTKDRKRTTQKEKRKHGRRLKALRKQKNNEKKDCKSLIRATVYFRDELTTERIELLPNSTTPQHGGTRQRH